MAIIFDKENKVFTLHTNTSTYQMKIDEWGYLLHTYYGARIDETDMSTQLSKNDRGFSGNPYEVGKINRGYSLDVLPQEYSCFGTGDFRITGLHVRDNNGALGASLKYKSHAISEGLYKIEGLPAVYSDTNEGESLEVKLVDEVTGLEVVLKYGILEELDLITRSATLINSGDGLLDVEKAASINLDFPFGNYDITSFYGRHAMERNAQRSKLNHGTFSVGSVRGTSSHHYNPFVIISDTQTNEMYGDAYGFTFLYSGEFLAEAEVDQINQTRFTMGIHPDNFCWKLEAGSKLNLPQVAMIYSANGFTELSHKQHSMIRNHVCRGEWKNKRRPVLINNWEGTYFDFTGQKIYEMAKDAKELGIELFVLDDGWFGKRDDDNSGLGDWTVNEKKLGCTLKELVDRINELGLSFGIWFEPEAISEDSDLYRQHPDWALTIPGRQPNLSRNELLLDFSRKEVCDNIIEQMSAVLSSANISYVKWDMNRSQCDKYSRSLGKDRQGEFTHRFILGLYYVLETLTNRFPNVLFEGCSGGGGRFDAGMLHYTPQIWCSDNTDAINRLDIQYGTSFAYPVSSVGAHVSTVPNHQTGRVTSIKTRAITAMAGTFGLELDVTKMTEDDKLQTKQAIEIFKSHYDLIQRGDYYRLTPVCGCTAWAMVSKDGTEALVSAVYKNVEANAAPSHIKVPGLRADGSYMIKDSLSGQCLAKMSGLALKNAGITLPTAREEFDSLQLYISME